MTPQEIESEIRKDMARFTHNPLGFVLYSYPWGKGELEGHEGPMPWAREVYTYIGERLKYGAKNGHHPIRIAVASGNGITKSATVAQLIDWGLSTCEDARIIVTANSAGQLSTKTWPEVAKWHRVAINEDWFEYTATALTSTTPKHDKTWRADAIPWNITRPESVAGQHNKRRRIIIIFDEASGIPKEIWEAVAGAQTDSDTEIIWIAFGNPTRNSGSFFDCFHSQKHLWKCWQVDSRNVPITNKKQIQEWVDTYGEDSDYVKIHVRGEFPATSDRQFISTSLVEAARKRVVLPKDVNFAATIIGVDPAWTGGDPTVAYKRQGNLIKKLFSFPKNDDDFQTAGYVANHETQEKADAVFVDFGYGTGIVSAGKQMGREWKLIQFGAASPDPRYLNFRAYMWGQVKQYLIDGGSIPDDPVLAEQLCSVEYFVVASGPNAGKIALESKDDMKRRGLCSPNDADAVAMTFAYPVVKRDILWGSKGGEMANTEYEPLADE